MVYVDDMDAPFGRMLMSHLWSDSNLEELHRMALRIGVRRKWFQCRRVIPGNERVAEDRQFWPLPHYDVCKEMKEKALEYGAILLPYGTNVEWMDTVRLGRLLHPQRVAWLERKRRKRNARP